MEGGAGCGQRSGMPRRQPLVASQELRRDGDMEGGAGCGWRSGMPRRQSLVASQELRRDGDMEGGAGCGWRSGMPRRQPLVSSQELRRDGDMEGGAGCGWRSGMPRRQPLVSSQELRRDGDMEGGAGCGWRSGMPRRQSLVSSQELPRDGGMEGGPDAGGGRACHGVSHGVTESRGYGLPVCPAITLRHLAPLRRSSRLCWGDGRGPIAVLSRTLGQHSRDVRRATGRTLLAPDDRQRSLESPSNRRVLFSDQGPLDLREIPAGVCAEAGDGLRGDRSDVRAGLLQEPDHGCQVSCRVKIPYGNCGRSGHGSRRVSQGT